jgi:O-antigen/teichoic acid export membrane protein
VPAGPAHRAVIRSPRLALLAGFAGSGGLNYAFGVVAAHLLVPAAFGVVAVAQGIIVLAGLVLAAGVPTVLAARLAGPSVDAPARVVRGALLMNVSLAVLLAAAICAVALHPAVRESLGGTHGVMLIVATLPAVSVLAAGWGAAQGRGAFGTCAVINVVESGTKMIVGTALMALAGSADGAAGAIAGGIAGAGAVRRVTANGPRGVSFPPLGEAGATFVGQVAQVALVTIDLICVRAFGGSSETAGMYQAALILANAPYFVIAAAVVPVLYTRVAAGRDLRTQHDAFSEALTVVALVTVPIEAFLLVYPSEALGLVFPPGYTAASTALRFLAVGTLCLAVLAVCCAFLQASGAARICATTLAVSVVAEVPALAIVVPLWSMAGAAAVFAVATSSALASTLVLARRSGIALSLPGRHALTGLACAAAAGVVVTGLLQTSTPVAAALTVGSATYGTLLVRLGVMRRPS